MTLCLADQFARVPDAGVVAGNGLSIPPETETVNKFEVWGFDVRVNSKVRLSDEKQGHMSWKSGSEVTNLCSGNRP